MWEKLSLVRVYTKPKGKQPDFTAPVVLRKNKCSALSLHCQPKRADVVSPTGVEDFCKVCEPSCALVQLADYICVNFRPFTSKLITDRIESAAHPACRDIVNQFRVATVWGSSAKHMRGQRVGLEHILMDEGKPFFAHQTIC